MNLLCMSSFLWLYELICFTVIVRYASTTSIIFGFRTPSDHGSDSVVTLTLFWDMLKYQCNVYPTEYSTFYSCNTSNTTTTLSCDRSITDIPIEHGLQMDNDDWDDLIIDSINIKISEYSHVNIVHNDISIEYFCLDSNQSTNNLSIYCTDTLTISAPMLIPLGYDTNNKSNVQIQPQSSRCVPSLSSTQNTDKYILIPQKKTWFEAQTYCKQNLHSNLASLTSDEDVAIAVAIRDSSDHYYNQGIWIGLTDNQLLSSGDWMWIDNTSCDYTVSGLCKDDIHWGPNEPNEDADAGEDCAEIGHKFTFGLFNDIICTEKRIFLCNNASFVNIITTQPQLTMSTEHISTGQHVDEGMKHILIYVVIVVVVVIVIICICLCFYGKKWIKQQIKEETKKQRENDIIDVSEVKVMNSNPRRITLTPFEPGRTVHRLSKMASSDGYVGVNKDSGDDEEKDITAEDTLNTVTGAEGYVKPWGNDSNQSNMDDDSAVNKGLISNEIKANDENVSDSEDLYMNPKQFNDAKFTATPTTNGMHIVCSAKKATQGSDNVTRGNVDPNTPGSDS